MWTRTRELLKAKLAELPVETHADAAGNLWSTLRARSDKAC
jgi:N-carbamoyl-L-amino-acid hydrolase